jgi:lipoprotein-anchoring transpeptidase ErfK/SrfK
VSATHLRISIAQQRLWLCHEADIERAYPVSTAAAGAGERMGSYQTPRGRHRIRALIGRGQPVGTVFVARRPTGEIYSPELGAQHPQRDWILTRILWLAGLEPGFNRYGAVDTQRRYIYIHGSPDHVLMGVPGSKGCIRMRNADLIELFEACHPGMPVLITQE